MIRKNRGNFHILQALVAIHSQYKREYNINDNYSVIISRKRKALKFFQFTLNEKDELNEKLTNEFYDLFDKKKKSLGIYALGYNAEIKKDEEMFGSEYKVPFIMKLF